MYMLKSVVSVALFAAYAVAQSTLAFTSVPTSVQAGQSYTITWAGGDATQPVTIILRQGDPQDLQTVGTLTSAGTGGTFTWNVDTTIADASDYAFEIVQGTDSNYSNLFAVSGGTGTLTTASASATAASASASTVSASASESASASAASASASSSESAAASSTLSSSASKTSASAASTSAPSSNGANGLQSPIALIFGAVAAMFYLA